MTPACFSRKHVFSENFGLHYVLPPWLHTTQTDDCFDPANRDHDMNKNQFCQWHWSWQWCDLVIALGALSVPVILIWLALLTYQILQYLNKPLFQKKKLWSLAGKLYCNRHPTTFNSFLETLHWKINIQYWHKQQFPPICKTCFYMNHGDLV